MIGARYEFNRATFGLPVESYRVDSFITKGERLPVVTEFVLRLLRICGPITVPAFRDYFELRDRIADRGDAFLRGLVEHLFAYGSGRPPSFADAEAIDGIMVAAKADGAGLGGILLKIVTTPEFRTK